MFCTDDGVNGAFLPGTSVPIPIRIGIPARGGASFASAQAPSRKRATVLNLTSKR